MSSRKRRSPSATSCDVIEKSPKERKLDNGLEEDYSDEAWNDDKESAKNNLDCEIISSDDGVLVDTVLKGADVKSVDSVKSDINKAESIDLSPDINQTLITYSPSTVDKDLANVKLDSVDSGRGSSVSASDISVRTPGEAENCVFNNFPDSASSSSYPVSRQNSGGFDSALCSPVSEKCSVLVKNNVQEESYEEPLVPLLAGVSRPCNRGRLLGFYC